MQITRPPHFPLCSLLGQMLNPGSSLSPRYGSGICWLTNKYALLLFFAAPLFVLLLLNIVFFLISARNISRAKKSSARMLGKEEDSKMAIYVKLTFVMGITWILGFLAALVPNNPVRGCVCVGVGPGKACGGGERESVCVCV